MNGTVAHEFLLLLLTLLIGAGIGLLFDCYRLLRRFVRPGWFCTQVADLLYWVICAALVFGTCFFVTGGETRLATLLMILLGMAIYLKFASRYVRQPLYLITIRAGRFLKFCCRLLLIPFHFFKSLISFFIRAVSGLIRLLFLPARLSLSWLRRKLKELWRYLRGPRPPHQPPRG